ncbi:hypothetical protein [Paraflavitalea speifideaquila]|uniref:hypothetical protein n=1 Tax=Paraflavitalea speifideaquila TaxID=3076558 RepID=UPI0028EE6ABB|nr:hypothetical protein [Paraflavitalea speifideiaquila]
MYAGGAFTSIGGQMRGRVAVLDATTGTANAWDLQADAIVRAIKVSGNRIYVGGDFNVIAGGAVNYFAAFGLIALPVELLSFTARNQAGAGSNTAVLCQWSTATEQNSDHFIIERSNNGTTFIPIGQVAAKGIQTPHSIIILLTIPH